MALSDEQIARTARSVLETPVADGVAPAWALAVGIARAIEAEVRKQDDALIQQLMERLERADKISGYPNNHKIIAEAKARLNNKPS